MLRKLFAKKQAPQTAEPKLDVDVLQEAYSIPDRAGAHKVSAEALRDKLQQKFVSENANQDRRLNQHPVMRRTDELVLSLGVIQLADKQTDYTFYEQKPGFGINSITKEGGRIGYHPFVHEADLQVVENFGRHTMISVPMDQSEYSQMPRQAFLEKVRSEADRMGLHDLDDSDLLMRTNIAMKPGYINNPATGLQAVAVIDRETDRLIIGVPGMNGEKVETVEAAIRVGKRQADVLMEEILPTVVEPDNRRRQIVLAGHSLGGSVVQHAGYRLQDPTRSTRMLDVQVLNFEGPAISHAVPDYDPCRVSSERTLNIAVEGSLVARWGTAFGGSHLGGEMHYLQPTFDKGLNNMMRNHQMDCIASSLAWHMHTAEMPRLEQEAGHLTAVATQARNQKRKEPDLEVECMERA